MANIVPSDSSYRFPTWTEMKEQASMLVRSGFLPNSVNTPEKAVAIMLKGKEIGMPTMQAMSQIAVIQGKPVLSPEGQLALIYRNCPGVVINFLQLDDEACVVEAKRPGKDSKFQRFSFSMADASKAGLSSKDNWRKYPRAMLRSRCIGEMARSLFPDAICGISYTPEELGAEVEVTESGDVVIQAQNVRDNAPSQPRQVEAEISEDSAGPKEIRYATPKQVNLVKLLAKQNGWQKKNLEHILREVFNTEEFEQIKFDDVNPILKAVIPLSYEQVCQNYSLTPMDKKSLKDAVVKKEEPKAEPVAVIDSEALSAASSIGEGLAEIPF